MYYPIIKNKINELKGIKQVNSSLEYTPIIELVDTKSEDLSNFFKSLIDERSASIIEVAKEKHCFIDIPSYLDNEIINVFNLRDSEQKYNFFIALQSMFESNSCRNFTPVISFDHAYATPRKSYKENINFAKQIINNFDHFAIRLFSNNTFKNDDYALLWQLYDFLGAEIETRATLIFDVDNLTVELTNNIIKEIKKEFKIKHIILAGEVFKDNLRVETEYNYRRFSNPHLNRYNEFLNTFNTYNIKFDYADFTLTDKIPSKIEIDPEKGFLYYPFIKFTTEDAKFCMFTADEKGNYKQYQELCKRVVSEIREFSPEHCSTCAFIKQVAITDEPDSIAYKGGSVWKHRMIAHHITALAMCI